MICVVITGPTYEKAFEQLTKACSVANLVELRLDCFESLDLEALKTLRSSFSIPMIFTLRSFSQGGHYPLSEEKRLEDIRNLLELEPQYFDIETHVPLSFIKEISSLWPKVKLIVSYHNFSETPQDLQLLYQEMRKVPAHFYKIAVMARARIDTWRLINWANQLDPKLIAISMGEYGQISRILAPILGCPFTYAAIDEDQKSAPGQLTAKILKEQYHHHSLNSDTKVYGLIGDPVVQSISDVTHNSLIKAFGFNAIYLKIQVDPKELPDFLQFAKKLPFLGLSVTMPLKEHILPYLDQIDSKAKDIGAVNTLVFEKGKIIGYNTDSIGALNAIEEKMSVLDKQIVILGAGGAAKAIAYEACQRGAKVTIVNRDFSKAMQVAGNLQCASQDLTNISTCYQQGYDIIINSTPMPMPISSDYILPHALVMDIMTKPKETLFLKQAKEKGCQVVYGYQMFVEQALGQFQYWFKRHFDIQKGRDILNNKAVDCLS